MSTIKISDALPGKPFGRGKDGDVNFASTATLSVPRIGVTSVSGRVITTAGDPTSSFSVGDLIHLWDTLAGKYQYNLVESLTSTTLTVVYPLLYSYASYGQISKVFEYRAVTTNSSITLTVPVFNYVNGGIFPLVAQKSITLGSGATISAVGLNGDPGGAFAQGTGFWGGPGVYAGATLGHQGGGTGGYGTNAQSANGTGGGGGQSGSGYGQQGGGGGGHAASGSPGTSIDNGTPGAGGGTDGDVALTELHMGGGGGGGMHTNGGDQYPGNGAGGGGVVILISELVDISAGYVLVSGGAGQTHGYAGGGGGAGGSVLIQAGSAILGTNRALSSGGSGGVGGAAGGDGGDGAVGRIHVDYRLSLSGTTTPTLNSAQDVTLFETAGAGILALM